MTAVQKLSFQAWAAVISIWTRSKFLINCRPEVSDSLKWFMVLVQKPVVGSAPKQHKNNCFLLDTTKLNTEFCTKFF